MKLDRKIGRKIITILILLILISNFYPVLAYDEESFGFTRKPTSHTTNCWGTPYSPWGTPQTIIFKTIQNHLDLVSVSAYIEPAAISTHPSKNSGYKQNVEIRTASSGAGVLIATATVGYNRVDNGYYINVLEIENWNISGLSGEDYLFFNYFDFDGLEFKCYDPEHGFGDNANDISIGLGGKPAANITTANTKQTWWNTYQQFDIDLYPYKKLDITKVIDGDFYDSKWKIVDGTTTIFNESSLNHVNSSLYLYEDTTHIYCEDAYGETYSDVLTWEKEAPEDDGIPNTLSGLVKNAKTGTLLDNVSITLDTKTGYGGNYSTSSIANGSYIIDHIVDDNYKLEANYLGYEDYSYDLTITKNQTHNILMVKNITLDAGKSGLYGVITNYYNSSAVPNVYLKIYNDSWSSVAYSNSDGYYEFLNFAPGTYTLSAKKNNYHPVEYNLTFSADELKCHSFMLTSKEIPEEPTPPSPPLVKITDSLMDILNMFGLSGEFAKAIIALFIIILMGALLSRVGAIAAIGGMFFGFIVSMAMGLLPAYLLAIVIIVVILLILQLRGSS